ncbi:MAG: VCBS repeat-containing protein [Ignavibacteria bacterium]|nr:VCBS repeat-containing protein [Ignavibacteria bacterium]
MKLLFSLLLTFIQIAYSQNWIRIDSIFTPNEIQAISFSSPFFCDIDGDSDLDLFIGSSSLSNILFFRNVGSPTEPRFIRDDNLLKEVNLKEYHNSPSYPFLADLDGDGDYDLILSTFKGLQFYRNVGDKNYPIFFKIDNFFFEVNKFTGNDAKPALVDIDGDGDLDLFIGIGESLFGGPVAGTVIGFRNTGRKTFPRFVRDKALTTGIADLGLNAFPAFVDLNGDGKYEILIGRDQNTFAYFINAGTKKNPKWIRQPITFGDFEKKSYWKNPTFADIDNDGDMDLIYGSGDGELYFYRNIGTRKNPKFKLEAQLFEPIRIAGGSPSVSFADFDKDGDYDLLSGDYLGGFQYFKNIGNKYRPVFRRSAASFTSLKVQSFSTPIFVDYDNDGDLDIISGALDGRIYVFTNTKNGYIENANPFKNVRFREKSAPAAVDINNNGLTDFLFCSGLPNQYLFMLNQGKGNFKPDNSLIERVSFPYDARPTFADVDRDGDFDLIIGGRDGRLIYFENTGIAEKPYFELNRDLFKDVKVKQNSSPGFADLDGDGRPELVVGEYNGNFYYFKANFPLNLVNFYARAKETFTPTESSFDPFAKELAINFKISKAKDIFNPFKPEFVLINLYDNRGDFVRSIYSGFLRPGEHNIKFNLREIATESNFYLYTIQISNGEFYWGKFFFLK